MRTTNFTYNLDVAYQPGVDHRVCKRMRSGGMDVSEFLNGQKTSIYLCWNFGGKYYKQNVGYKVLPACWSFEEKLPSKKHSEYRRIRTLLISILSRIDTGMLDMRLQKTSVTADSIRNLVENSVNSPAESGIAQTVIFWNAYDEFVEEKKQLSKPGTIVKYQSLKKTLLAFEKEKYKMSFEGMTKKFYNDFLIFSMGKGYYTNTTGKHVAMLKSFMNYAYDMKYSRSLEYKRFKVESEITDPVFLTKGELKLIEDYDTGVDTTLSRSKDFFLLCVYTGQRCSDVARMKVKHVKKSNDGSMEWELYQAKGKRVRAIRLYIVKPARRILERYLTGKSDDDLVFEGISTVVVNRQLKKLGELAGINATTTKVNYSGSNRIEKTLPKYMFLTTHVGRKTLASQMCAANIPDHEIQSITGHSSLRSMKVYKGVDRANVIEGMKKVFEK